MTKFATVDLNRITPHPRNVRRDATPDDELVNSIRAQGILQPLGVVGAEQGYLLIAGHRRHAAAVAAGLTQAPVVILEHLDTEAKQLEAMLVENGRRQDLTAMEEATAYEQLTILGSDVDQIATATGRAKGTVRSRLKLATLSTRAQDAVHSHQLTLDQAEQLTALADFPEIVADLEDYLGDDSFHWRLRSAGVQRERALEHRQLRTKYEALNLPEIDRPETGWDYGAGPCPTHDPDEADAWYRGNETGDYDGKPSLIITAPNGPDAEKERAERQAETERLNAERKAAQEARSLSDRLRLEHVIALAPALRVTDTDLMNHLQAGTARIVAELTNADMDDVVAASGVKLERAKNDYSGHHVAGQVLEFTTTQVIQVLVAALAVKSRSNLHIGYSQHRTEAKANAAAYWAGFEISGYSFTEDDIARRAELDEPDEAQAS